MQPTQWRNRAAAGNAEIYVYYCHIIAFPFLQTARLAIF